MNCDAFTAKLDAILDAALCACQSLGSGYGSEVTPAIYSDLEDGGTLAWVLPDATTVPAADDRCALAQLVWAMSYEILTEYLQPLQEAAHHVLLPAVLAAIAVILGGPAALIPGAALYGIIVASLDAWVEGELQSVETELLAQKIDLVCSMYNAWVGGGKYSHAAAAAAAVIDGSSQWTDIDKALFKLMFSPFTMEICQDAWTAQSAWAVANVTAGYCTTCGTGEREDYYDFNGADWESPDWTLTGNAEWWDGVTGYPCQGTKFLRTPGAASTAWTVVAVPGPGLHDLEWDCYALGSLGNESQVWVYLGESDSGPWDAVVSGYYPALPELDCGYDNELWQDIDLDGYTHVKYLLQGVGVAPHCNWMNVTWTWTLPE